MEARQRDQLQLRRHRPLPVAGRLMANDVSLPNMQEPVFPGGKPPTSAYRKFFEKLSRLTATSTEFQAEIAEIILRLDALEEGGADLGEILGLGSISVTGSLGEQVVIQLKGDESLPAASYYYGTNADGEKGFYVLPPIPPTVAGEILIQDGSSAPPVMLTNEAEDDFLYGDT